MSRRVVVALIVLALTTGACASTEGRASRRRTSHMPRERVHTVARKIVDRGAKVAWSTATDGEPAAVAADGRGEVVVVDHERVGALDSYGRVLWTTDFADVVTAVPALVGDRVIVPFERTNGSGGCAGLDRETGEIRWRYEAIVTGGVTVASARGFVLCVMQNGQSASISPTLGIPRWEFTFGQVDPSTIEVPAGTSIAVDEANDVFAFVARLGETWQLTTRSITTGHTQVFVPLGSAGTPSAPMVVGVGFFGVASGGGDFCVFSIEKHLVVRVPLSVADGFDPASVPIRVGDVAMVFGRAGEIIAVDIASGDPRWTTQSGFVLRKVHAIVLGDTLMVPTWTGDLVAVSVTDGSAVRMPWRPGQAIAMLFSGGSGAAIAVGQDGDSGWIERWEPKPGS
jgi:outer membrane protein assembly factor BamB